jgi:hypothetical protein
VRQSVLPEQLVEEVSGGERRRVIQSVLTSSGAKYPGLQPPPIAIKSPFPGIDSFVLRAFFREAASEKGAPPGVVQEKSLSPAFKW